MRKKIIDYFSSLSSNKKINACSNVFYSLYFDSQNNIRVCPKQNYGILIRNFDGIWLDTGKIAQNRKSYINSFKIGNPDTICLDCEYLKNGIYTEQNELKEIHLGHWKNCYLKCRYCNSEKNENLIQAKHYNVFDAINRLIDEKQLTTNTRIIFECGDALIHPEFDKLLYFFINYESKEIVVNTPALTYRESIAEAIAKNVIKLIVNIDCANTHIYKYIKGEDCYDIVTANLQRYLQYQEPKEKRVLTKITLYKGGNDGKKELSDWFVLSRDLGINEMIVDIDEAWFAEMKEDIPDYLKEMLFFIKNIAQLNGVVVDFSPKIEKLYEKIRSKK